MTKTRIQPSLKLAAFFVAILATFLPSTNVRNRFVFSPSNSVLLVVDAILPLEVTLPISRGGIPEACWVHLAEMIACVETYAFNYTECVNPAIDLEDRLSAMDFLEVYSPPPDSSNCFDMEGPICPDAMCFTPCRQQMMTLYECRVMSEEFFSFVEGPEGPPVMSRQDVESCFPMACEDFLNGTNTTV